MSFSRYRPTSNVKLLFLPIIPYVSPEQTYEIPYVFNVRMHD